MVQRLPALVGTVAEPDHGIHHADGAFSDDRAHVGSCR